MHGGRSSEIAARLTDKSPWLPVYASRVWPCAVGGARGYATATEQKSDSSAVLRSKQSQQFDWALAKLDSSVRRTGRITKTFLLRIFHDICRRGYPSSNQALLLLRSCGLLLPEVPAQERTELAHRVWEKLKELGSQYDVSHYNALLKVYLQNEFKFSPTDFLAKMEAANVQPNRVTYQRLIAAYCQNGDIEGASTILGFMKSKDLPITEAVFNSLVTGHARAGDIESAENILPVMQGAGIEPGPDTYISLLNAHAEKGDLDSLKKTMEAAERADASLMDRDLMQVIFTMAKAGHQQHIPDIVTRLRHERGYIPDAMNLCLSLITLGLEDTAFSILKTFPTLQSENADDANLGNFFLRHCVTMDVPLEKIAEFCKELQELNLHTSTLTFTLSCALEASKTALSLKLMKLMKEQDLPVRPHYFWPLFTQHAKDGSTAGVVEVLKGMEDLEVSPDVETLTSYVLPVFPSMEAARRALEDAGLSMKSEAFLIAEVRLLALTNLAELYTLLSDASYPSLDLSAFCGSLIHSFKKFADMESMVKITELLYKDKRFSAEKSTASAEADFFLYNVINSMSEKEVQAQEDKLQKYFNQLQAQNINIPLNTYRGIKNILDSYNAPALIKYVFALVDPQDQGFRGSSPRAAGADSSAVVLKRLAELKAENKPFDTTLKQAIRALCAEENMEHALELKREHEDVMMDAGYASLINLCCRHNNVEEALNLKREMTRKDSSFRLDASKYLLLVKALLQNGRLDEALDILKEMKKKEVAMDDLNQSAVFYMLCDMASRGDIPAVRLLQDTIFILGLTKPTSNLCSPLITAYLDSNNLPGALEAVLECHKLYGHLPRIHDVTVALMENGETELLQRAMDYVSQERGEMAMLYGLFFGFLQTGRYREARKILETPGLRARPGRLNWFAEKCISSNQMEALEQMVDMTDKLFECDRDEMYSYILRLCKVQNNWEKAEAVWMKMQENNVIPRERTLEILADILKNNGKEVPFEMPETWYKQAASVQQVKTAAVDDGGAKVAARLVVMCKKGHSNEAYEILKKLNNNGVALNPSTYDHVIRALLAKGSIKDALAVKDIALSRVSYFRLSDIATNLLIVSLSKNDQAEEALEKLKSMMQTNYVPSQLAVTRLVQALGNHGNVAGIQEVQSLVNSLGTTLNLSNMVFVNNTAVAHIKNGDVDLAVESLEAVYTSPDSTNPSISFVFRKVLSDDDDKALDKLSAMAERLANHFACYIPASDLFLQLLDVDKVEDAKFMLARCHGLAEQKSMMMSFLAHKAQIPGQVGKIKTLLSLIPDFIEKNVLYSYLMKCHVMDKDLSSAKALHEQMQVEGVVPDELSLKRLARLYSDAGETAPFTEPPESFKFYADKLKASKVQAPNA
ncbi:leucine-rich PPR motif-containing protein, mitochondrial isoform 2-T2 [Spinachia spinachia]